MSLRGLAKGRLLAGNAGNVRLSARVISEPGTSAGQFPAATGRLPPKI